MARQLDQRKATVISLCPFPVKEYFPTVYPGEYFIPGTEDVETLIIDNARGYVYLDADRGSLKVAIAAEEIAAAFVNDRMRATVEVSVNTRPGLFWVIGDYTPSQAKEELKVKINEARKKQNAWLLRLVTVADDDWNKFKQHKMISSLQRMAAKNLGIEREWITAVPTEDRMCPMCREQVHPMAVLCGNCKFILKPEDYAKHKERFLAEK